jgi:hypothetical protein
MRTTYFGFILWFAGTMLFISVVFSSHAFSEVGSPHRKLLGRRLLLCFVWPIALLSKAGRDYLFATTKGE